MKATFRRSMATGDQHNPRGADRRNGEFLAVQAHALRETSVDLVSQAKKTIATARKAIGCSRARVKKIHALINRGQAKLTGRRDERAAQ